MGDYELYHADRKQHKYIKKIGDRYFYTQAQIKAYLDGKNESGDKGDSAGRPVTSYGPMIRGADKTQEHRTTRGTDNNPSIFAPYIQRKKKAQKVTQKHSDKKLFNFRGKSAKGKRKVSSLLGSALPGAVSSAGRKTPRQKSNNLGNNLARTTSTMIGVNAANNVRRRHVKNKYKSFGGQLASTAKKIVR